MISDGAEEGWVRCDVCRRTFQPGAEGQRRCSRTCRDFARDHRGVRSATLHVMYLDWRASVFPCPSGKTRHQVRKDAEAARRKAVRERYRACPDWLRVYQCDLCRGGWHLTSNPARAGNLVPEQGGER